MFYGDSGTTPERHRIVMEEHSSPWPTSPLVWPQTVTEPLQCLQRDHPLPAKSSQGKMTATATEISRNAKTGPLPVAITDAAGQLIAESRYLFFSHFDNRKGPVPEMNGH
jgi:hypothetical protein